MIAIISEHKYTNDEIKNLRKQGCVVNYTMMPQYYNNYSDEITKINNLLIANSSAIIFRIEDFYYNTKQALERALYFKKKCKVICDNTVYFLDSLEDLRNTTGYGSNTQVYKHPLLLIYEAQRSKYFEEREARKEAEKYERATAGVNIPREEVIRFVNTFKYLYDIDVDVNNTADLYLAYKSLKYYLEHDIDYSNAPTSEDFPYDIISFGDITYMEDFIYKNKAHV